MNWKPNEEMCKFQWLAKMGAKDSKQSCISYEDAVKRGKWSSTRARIENIQNL